MAGPNLICSVNGFSMLHSPARTILAFHWKPGGNTQKEVQVFQRSEIAVVLAKFSEGDPEAGFVFAAHQKDSWSREVRESRFWGEKMSAPRVTGRYRLQTVNWWRKKSWTKSNRLLRTSTLLPILSKGTTLKTRGDDRRSSWMRRSLLAFLHSCTYPKRTLTGSGVFEKNISISAWIGISTVVFLKLLV